MIKLNTKKIYPTDTVYLSGPMTGLPDYNREAFRMRAEGLKAAGYNVLNPADISVAHGTDKSYGWYLKRALHMMLEADVVYVFGDIDNSLGVTLELLIANHTGMKIVREEDNELDNQTL